MGLSSNNARETVTTNQVLLTIAQGLKSLMDDPKALEKAAKEAYALPEAEEKKAAQAKEIIAKMEGLIAEQKRRQDDLDAQESELDDRERKLKETVDSINGREIALEKRSRELDGIAEGQKQAANDIATGRQDLDAAIVDHERNVGALDKREREVNDYEASLKETAAKMQGLTKGL